MKKIMAAVALLSLTSIGWAATNREATVDRMDHAAGCCMRYGGTRQGHSARGSEHAKCVAVVPHLLKGGFVIGAENGRGSGHVPDCDGWSAPAFFAITGGSWGLQIGV